MRVFLPTCLGAAAAAGDFAPPAAAGDFAPPRFSVSLDVAPEHRWDGALTTMNASLHTALGLLLSNPVYKLGLGVVQALVKADEMAVADWFPDEQWRELQGIARLTGVAPELLAGVDAIYDLTAGGGLARRACTSVVAQAADGSIVAGRNLDYPLQAEMRGIAMHVDFTRGNTTVFSAVSYAGFTGFNTAVKPGVLTVSQDERDQGPLEANWADLFLLRRASTMAAIRAVVDEQATFEGAVQAFAAMPLAADSYFVLGGAAPGEGAVVTRSRQPRKEADVWRLGDANASWYLFETNYDHWGPAGGGDDRRTPGHAHLDKAGAAGFDTGAMWGALSDFACDPALGQRAVYNNETVYTWVGSAALGSAASQVMVRGSYPGVAGCA